MNQTEHVKSRQICWEDSVSWKRHRPEPDLLWTDSNKQKLLLIKYNRGKNESSQRSGKMILTLAPEVKEMRLLGRETIQATAKEPHCETVKEQKSNGRQKTGRADNDVEDAEKCLYCNERTPLGTNHSSLCRKLFSLNAKYTHYNLALHSKWTAPSGFPGKKQNPCKRLGKRSAKDERHNIPLENTMEPDPLAEPPPGMVSPASVEENEGEEDEVNDVEDREEEKNEKQDTQGTAEDGDKGKAGQENIPWNFISRDCPKGHIPRSIPLPISFSRSNSPDTFASCLLCHTDFFTGNAPTNTPRTDVETRTGSKCEHGQHSPKTREEMNISQGGFNVSGKDFRATFLNSGRAFSGSPFTSPPPPTPVTGAWPPLPVEARQSTRLRPNVTVTNKGRLSHRANQGHYMSPQLRWCLQIIERPVRGYGMFMPNPPLRRKEDVRTPSPGPEAVLAKLGLKFKVPYMNKHVQKRRRKKPAAQQGFLGKQGGLLPPIGCREALQHINTLAHT